MTGMWELLTAGTVIGLVFGIIIVRTNFCTLGAISDCLLFFQTDRLRFWIIIVLSAMLGTGILNDLTLLPLSDSAYWTTPVSVSGSLIGGGCFGVGMVFASGCIVKNITRIGMGSLKSLVVIVFAAVSAEAAMYGILSPLRNAVQQMCVLPISASWLTYYPFPSYTLWGLLFIGLLVSLFWKNRQSVRFLLSALMLGVMVTFGWWVTAAVNAMEIRNELSGLWTAASGPESIAYIRPLAKLLEHLLLGTTDGQTFGFGILLGTVLGACIGYRISGNWQWCGFADVKDLRNHLFGALLMGFGAVAGGGCTIGQGVSGLSAFSINALMTVLAIAVSAAAALSVMQRTVYR